MPTMADVLAGYGAGVPSYDPSQGPGPWYPAADIADTAIGMAARGLEHALIDPIKELGQASDTMRQTGEYNARPGFEMATNLAGAGMPFAAKGAAGIFGGRLSATADLKALAKAEQMAGAGENPEVIRQATGWFQGPEGAWKYEISDQAAKFRPMAEQGVMPKGSGVLPGTEGHQALLEHIVDHPELFEAYPWLRRYLNTWGEPAQIPGFRTRAAHSEATKQTWLNPMEIPGREEQLSSLLHEIQHAIQRHEGFARGASPGHPIVTKAADAEIKAVQKEAGDYLDKLYAGRDQYVAARQAEGSPESVTLLAQSYWKQNPDLHRQVRDLQDAISEIASGAWQADVRAKHYKNVAGEVESRNVQARQKYTDEERRLISPLVTEDVSRAEQLLRLGD